MLVQVIKKHVDYLGSRDTVVDIPENEAQVHIMLGNVKRCAPVADDKPAKKKAKKKRAYKRRDVEPEHTAVMEAVIGDGTGEATEEFSQSEKIGAPIAHASKTDDDSSE